jgi:hypothetical protein
MNKKILSLLAVASMALFFACSSDEAEDLASPQAKISVLVKDANSNQPLAGASLKLFPGGQTGITSNEGTANFDGVPAGSQILYIDKEGYASAMKSVSAITGVYTVNNTEEIPLYKLSGTITGSIYYPLDDEGKNTLPAEGATVRLTLTPSGEKYYFVKKVIEVKTGPDGKFVFDSLPAVGPYDYSLLVLEFERTINGKNVKFERMGCAGNCFDLTSGTVSLSDDPDLGTLVYQRPIEGSFTLLDYTSELADSSSPVVLNFSDAIDSAKSSNAIKVYNFELTKELPIDIVYGADKKSVTIQPLGKWNAASFYVYIEDLYSVKGGQPYSTDRKITIKIPLVDLGKQVVTGLTIASVTNAGKLYLEWSKVDGVTGYNIFVKAKEGSNRTAQVCGFTTATAGNKVTTEINLASSCYLNGVSKTNYNRLGLSSSALSDSVYFWVQAYNDNSKTLLNSVTAGGGRPTAPPNITGVTPVCTYTHVGLDESDGPYPSGIHFSCAAITGAASYRVYATSATSNELIYEGDREDDIWFNGDTPDSYTIYNRLGFSNEDIFQYGNLKFYVKAVGGGADNVSMSSAIKIFPDIAATQVPEFYIEQDADNLVFKFKPIMGASKYTITVSFNSSSPRTFNVLASDVNDVNPYWYEGSEYVGSSNISNISTMKIVAIDSFDNSSLEKSGSL